MTFNKHQDPQEKAKLLNPYTKVGNPTNPKELNNQNTHEGNPRFKPDLIRRMCIYIFSKTTWSESQNPSRILSEEYASIDSSVTWSETQDQSRILSEEYAPIDSSETWSESQDPSRILIEPNQKNKHLKIIQETHDQNPRFGRTGHASKDSPRKSTWSEPNILLKPRSDPRNRGEGENAVRKRRGGGTWWCSWSRSSRRTSRPRTRPALWSGRLWWKDASSSGPCKSFRSSNFLKPIERGRRRASSRSLRRRKMKSAWPFEVLSLSLSPASMAEGRRQKERISGRIDVGGEWTEREGAARAI